MPAEVTPDVVQLADTAADAIRELNTVTGGAIAPHLVQDMVDSLAQVAGELPQIFTQLAAGLELDLAATKDDPGRVAVIVHASDHLLTAARLAGQLAQELGQARDILLDNLLTVLRD